MLLAQRLAVGLIATVVALGTFAWAGMPAQAEGACPSGVPCLLVTVTGSDGSYNRTISRSDLESSDRRPTSYRLRSTPRGPTGDPETAGYGTSVSNLLVGKLQVPIESVESVSVKRTDQPGDVVLNGDQLEPFGSPGYPFDDGPPVFYSREELGVSFLRPLRAGDDSDVNSSDRFDGKALSVTVKTTGRILRPTLTASDESVAEGDAVQLTAANYDDATSFAWDFQAGDRTETSAPTTSHSWDSATTYDVTVTVRGASGVGVASVRVKVGKGSTGPPGEGGGGAIDGPATGGPGQGKQAGGVRGKGGAGQGGQGAKGTGTNSTDGSTSSTDGRTSTPDRTRQRGKQKQQAVADGERVNGILLDADMARTVPTQSGSSPKVASATTRKATDLPTDWRWLLAGVPLLLLLAGGATRSRWLTRRLPEPPWRSS